MNIDDLKDQLKDQWAEFSRKVQDSPAYTMAREKYDLLEPRVQKIVVFGSLGLLAVLILSIPISMLFSASSDLDEFDENKLLIRQLLRTDRAIKQGPRAPRPMTASSLSSRVKSTLSSAGLLEEQILGTKTVSPRVDGMLPKDIDTSGVLVSLAKLNLKQVVNIGFALQSISESVKLTSLDVNANREDDHYYDVNYELATFSIPIKEDQPEPEAKKGRKKPARRRNRRGK